MHPGSGNHGEAQPTADWLLSLIDEMTHHSYGERVNMAEHSLQTAANAQADNAADELIAAALLHDAGHLFGDAGEWGLPDHAHRGAQALQAILPISVVEPIRLHVDAKRYLVATDPTYEAALSHASQQTLRDQGGPFTPDESEAFLARPHAVEAVLLRRYDDAGKTVGVVAQTAESYRPLLERLLAVGPSS